jgi:spoIIIJ-associated protein
MTEDKTKKAIKETAQKLLQLMGFKEIKVELSVDENDVFHLDIDCEDSGILIGHHGETLSSLQLIVSLVVYKRLGKWQRILVNVGDWREKRIEALKKMALNATQRVKFSNEEVFLPHLNAGERRIIHLYLADHPDVTTESVGEGEERRLVIKPKK